MSLLNGWMGGALKGRVENSIRRAVAGSAALFSAASSRDEAERRKMLLSLVKTVLEAGGGRFTAANADSLRRVLAERHSPGEVDRMIAELDRCGHATAPEAAAVFGAATHEEKLILLESLVELSAGAASPQKAREFVSELATGLGVEAAELDPLFDKAEAEFNRRARIWRSGAGVLAAVIVIAVFILTATLLRSVIFGLIGAYLMLPVEKYFERRLAARRGFGFWLVSLLDVLLSPLRKMAAAIRRGTGNAKKLSPEDEETAARRRVINRSVWLTCAVLVVLVSAVGMVLSGVTTHYVRTFGKSVRDWSDRQNIVAAGKQNPAENAAPVGNIALSGSEKLLFAGRDYLENLKKRFESIPVVRFALEQIERVLNDDKAKQELAGAILKRTGGIFSFTAGVVGSVAAVLADLLLTIFFFLLFLTKLAEFRRDDDPNSDGSEYIVRTVFNGSWLPGAGDDALEEARWIISGVIARLRVWVRGYLTLMLVDATVYTTVFFFLKVPYFPLLGMLAGCGILLPYIGPVLSASLTLLVTLAVGGDAATGAQIAGIVLAYLVYNGVIEQFILYPAVIGESLGLTTLETIIVVLLGAVFAGIPGMILSIPAASVIKYLVPQIYRCWDGRRGADS
ncbi:MAG: AI-2E family transporter [Victivallaceae bacterium]|nr:AI-2E family transporter [Victivallaceae bacterium]